MPDDCARAAVVISPRDNPGNCAARIIDRKLAREQGAMALQANRHDFEMRIARPPGDVRPWLRRSVGDDATAATPRPAARDATPRSEDLEIGD